MSSDSRSERERLKEKYKKHYRQMRDSREHLSRAEKTQNITEALKNMDTSQMVESFDNFLHSLKHKLASVEARLDVAMDSLTIDEHLAEAEKEMDEEINRAMAKDTIKQLKMEMGLLYKEIEQQAGSIQVEKTVGSGREEDNSKEQSPNKGPDKTKDQSGKNE